jgi:hypothetical protein
VARIIKKASSVSITGIYLRLFFQSIFTCLAATGG